MKKYIILFFSLFLSLTVTFATTVNYSDGEFSMNTEVKRNGDKIYLKYNVKNLSSAKAVNGISQDKLKAISDVEDVSMDAVIDCSSYKMKVQSLNVSGSKNNFSESTDWIDLPAENGTQLRELCSTVK